jgi:uncharacterized repeat protein (TIGR02543 family)
VVVTNAMPNYAAIFTTIISPTAVSVVVQPQGSGNVLIEPWKPTYLLGEPLTVIANPRPGQDFLGWTGTLTGTENPLRLTVSSNLQLTATFTSRALLSYHDCGHSSWNDTFKLLIKGELGDEYILERSTNLVHWFSSGMVTNEFGALQINQSISKELPIQFFRARSQME